MQKIERQQVLPYVLKTGLLVAAVTVCVASVLVANLLRLPKGWLYVLPGLVAFASSLGIGFRALYRLARRMHLSNLAPRKWISQGMFLFIIVLVLVLVLDGVWYLVQPELAQAFAASLSEARVTLPSQTAQEPAFPGIFNRLPVMVQSLFPVVAGTAAGCLLASLAAHRSSV